MKNSKALTQKSPRAHKNKIGTPPPPPKTQNAPPLKTRNFIDMGFSCRENAFFPSVHKIDAPISGPRIADTNFADTRIFLIEKCPKSLETVSEMSIQDFSRHFPNFLGPRGLRPRETFRSRANHEVQTMNWEAGGEGVVERGVKSSLKKAHKPWIRGKKGAQTVN